MSERENGVCVWCGRRPWSQQQTVEHLCPRSRGGVSEPANLLLACAGCNRRRRSRSAAAYAAERAREGAAPEFERLGRALVELRASSRRAHRDYAHRELRHLPAAAAQSPSG